VLGVIRKYILTKVLDKFFSKVRIWYYKLRGEKPPEVKRKERIEKLEKNLEKKENRLDERDKIERKLIEMTKRKEEKLGKKKEKLNVVREDLTVKERFIEAVERRGVSRKELIRKYTNKIPIIIINYHKNQPKGWLKEILEEKYDAVGLSGGGKIIPPDRVPKKILNKELTLDKWLEKCVYEGKDDRKSIIVHATLADLRNITWKKDFPSQTNTIEEQINVDHYLSNDFYKMEEVTNSIEHIEKGDIGFLASKYLTKQELKKIHNNQHKIERKLGNPNIKELSNEKIESDLVRILDDHVEDPDNVAEGIIFQAKLCSSILFEKEEPYVELKEKTADGD